jgi:hypothetical protein
LYDERTKSGDGLQELIDAVEGLEECRKENEIKSSGWEMQYVSDAEAKMKPNGPST